MKTILLAFGLLSFQTASANSDLQQMDVNDAARVVVPGLQKAKSANSAEYRKTLNLKVALQEILVRESLSDKTIISIFQDVVSGKITDPFSNPKTAEMTQVFNDALVSSGINGAIGRSTFDLNYSESDADTSVGRLSLSDVLNPVTNKKAVVEFKGINQFLFEIRRIHSDLRFDALLRSAELIKDITLPEILKVVGTVAPGLQLSVYKKLGSKNSTPIQKFRDDLEISALLSKLDAKVQTYILRAEGLNVPTLEGLERYQQGYNDPAPPGRLACLYNKVKMAAAISVSSVTVIGGAGYGIVTLVEQHRLAEEQSGNEIINVDDVIRFASNYNGYGNRDKHDSALENAYEKGRKKISFDDFQKLLNAMKETNNIEKLAYRHVKLRYSSLTVEQVLSLSARCNSWGNSTKDDILLFYAKNREDLTVDQLTQLANATTSWNESTKETILDIAKKKF